MKIDAIEFKSVLDPLAEVDDIGMTTDIMIRSLLAFDEGSNFITHFSAMRISGLLEGISINSEKLRLSKPNGVAEKQNKKFQITYDTNINRTSSNAANIMKDIHNMIEKTTETMEQKIKEALSGIKGTPIMDRIEARHNSAWYGMTGSGKISIVFSTFVACE